MMKSLVYIILYSFVFLNFDLIIILNFIFMSPKTGNDLSVRVAARPYCTSNGTAIDRRKELFLRQLV